MRSTWCRAEMCESLGYHRLGGLTKARAIQEMHHAEHLIERIIFLDGAPNMQTLEALQRKLVPAD